MVWRDTTATIQTFYDHRKSLMIWIFGDSFAASDDSSSWVSKLGAINNFASNGSSEYRIYKTYSKKKFEISNTDKIIFVHTSPTRIFLKNDKDISSRLLGSHPKCDIIINDVYEKKEKEYIKILESIWDEEYFNDVFDLLVDKLQVPNSFHITFFESVRKDVINLNQIWVANPGDINHMNETGNQLVADIICQLIR
jgi:hypothetical protein